MASGTRRCWQARKKMTHRRFRAARGDRGSVVSQPAWMGAIQARKSCSPSTQPGPQKPEAPDASAFIFREGESGQVVGFCARQVRRAGDESQQGRFSGI